MSCKQYITMTCMTGNQGVTIIKHGLDIRKTNAETNIVEITCDAVKGGN